jgi:hypothetical protein
MRRHDVGPRLGRQGRAVDEKLGVGGVDQHLGLEHGPDPLELPLGQVPPDGHHDGAHLPAGEGRDDVLGRVPQLDAEMVARPEPPLGQDAGELRRPVVELLPRQEALGAVLSQEGESDLVAPARRRAGAAGSRSGSVGVFPGRPSSDER